MSLCVCMSVNMSVWMWVCLYVCQLRTSRTYLSIHHIYTYIYVHIHVCLNKLYHTHGWIVLNTWMIDVTHMYESCDTHVWVWYMWTYLVWMALCWHVMAHSCKCCLLPHTASHYITLQLTATDCYKRQHTATNCKMLYITLDAFMWVTAAATDYNRLQQTATDRNRLQQTATDCNTLQQIVTDHNRLQHTATRCNTQQHIAYHPWLIHASITCSNWACSICVYASHKLSCSSTRDMTHPHVWHDSSICMTSLISTSDETHSWISLTQTW